MSDTPGRVVPEKSLDSIIEKDATGDLETLSPDNSVGLLAADEKFSESMLASISRLRRGLLAVEDEWPNADTIHIGVARNKSGRANLAFYPPGDRRKAVIVAPRVPEDGDAVSIQEVQTDE